MIKAGKVSTLEIDENNDYASDFYLSFDDNGDIQALSYDDNHDGNQEYSLNLRGEEKIDENSDGIYEILNKYSQGKLQSSTYDSNNNLKPDTTEYYDENGNTYQIEIDADEDGKWDEQGVYNGSKLSKYIKRDNKNNIQDEYQDTNNNGKFDWHLQTHYNNDGSKKAEFLDTNNDGNWDFATDYSNGKAEEKDYRSFWQKFQDAFLNF